MMEGVIRSEASAGVDADLVREERMLTRKVEILQEFLDQNQNARPPIKERCRVLQQRIESIEAGVSSAGRRDAARRFLESSSLNNQDKNESDDFLTWLRSHDGPTDHHSSPSWSRTPEPQSQTQHRSSSSFKIMRGSGTTISHVQKRTRTAASERTPCLRCRVLKKKCDSLVQCRHCPQQNDGNENDYWKVLGCHRGPLTSLSEMLSPADTRATIRYLRYDLDRVEIIQLDIRQGRLLDWGHLVDQLIETGVEFKYLMERDWLWERTDSHSRFSAAVESAITTGWSQSAQWPAYGQAVSSLGAWRLIEKEALQDLQLPTGDGEQTLIHLGTQQPLPFYERMEDFEPLWYIFHAISVEPSYLGQTEYNVFTLMRLGNKFSNNEPNVWDLFIRVKNLLVKAVEILLSEQAILGYKKSRTPKSISFYSKKWASVDIESDMIDFLNAFETTCSSRGKLSGTPQLACFYALLLFSIVKSLLIDAYYVQSEYEGLSHRQDANTVRVASAYKALVSVFSWASKSDLIVDGDNKSESYQFQMQETRQMLRQGQWEARGIKGSKDFLIGLGSSLLPDGAYNGFFIQKVGLSQLGNSFPKTVNPLAARSKWVGTPTDLSSLRLSERTSETGSPHPIASMPDYDDPTPQFMILPEPGTRGLANEPKQNLDAGWEHIVVGNDGLNRMSESPHDSRSVSSGRRKGKLDQEAKEKAARVRKLKACWTCWLLKTPCSEGSTCERCFKYSHGRGRVGEVECNRSSFVDYVEVFFPELLYSHLNKSFIQNIMNRHSTGFASDAFQVDVTWDGLCTTSLSVHAFNPKGGWDSELLRTTELIDGHFFKTFSAPVGIMALSISGMKRTFRDILHAALVKPQFHASVTAIRGPEVHKNALKIVFCYMERTDSLLLRNTLLLYLAYHIMNRTAVFTPSSTIKILEMPNSIGLAESMLRPQTSSYLLNLQIKYVLLKMARELASQTLEGLEKSLRSRTKDSWPVSFCTILLLCMCIEEIQIAANIFTMMEAVTTGKQHPTENPAVEPCRTLELSPLKFITDIFHDVYKSHKSPGEGGFSPLIQVLDGKDLNSGVSGVDQATQDMVRDLGQMITKSYPEMQALNQPLVFPAEPEALEKQNRGRLVSRFLLSFLDDDTLSILTKSSDIAQIDDGATMQN